MRISCSAFGIVVQTFGLLLVVGSSEAFADAADDISAAPDAWFLHAWVITLTLVGVFGILTELHIPPGNGVFGGAGILALLVALLLALGPRHFGMSLPMLSVVLILAAVLLYLPLRVLTKSAFFRRFTLTDAQGSGYVAGADYTRLLGCQGTAVSTLRPAGVAHIGEERVDVLTEGDFIEAGTLVRVSRVEGRRIFVKPLT